MWGQRPERETISAGPLTEERWTEASVQEHPETSLTSYLHHMVCCWCSTVTLILTHSILVPWCLFSDSLIHQKLHLATCHKQFSSYFRGKHFRMLVSNISIFKITPNKTNLMFSPYFKMTTYSDRVTDWPLIMLQGCMNSEWPLLLFSVLLKTQRPAGLKWPLHTPWTERAHSGAAHNCL